MDDWRHKFLKSKAWKTTRLFVLARDRRICRHCGKYVFGVPVVHHTVLLTQSNVIDENISLNLDLLWTLHHGCHDEIHERFGRVVKESIVDDELNIDYSKRKL